MLDLPLHELHASLGGRFISVNGLTAVEHYGDPLGEHQALRQTAGVLDLGFRGRLCLTGNDRQRFLNGQVTNNIKDLQPGQGCYAAILNHKGKMQGDLYIHALAHELLLDFEPGQAEAVTQRLDKFIIADDVQIVNVTPHYGLLSVQGPQAGAVVDGLQLGVPAPSTALQSAVVNHAVWGEICLANVARLGASGFDLFIPVAALPDVWSALLAAAARAGGRAAGWQAMETARIEAAIPRFGVDMNEANLAPEAGIESRAISYTKGCYTGQEVIARIRTYGQVARKLRLLWLEDGGEALPAPGDKVYRDGKEVGYVTSAVASPALHRRIALAYIRREHFKPEAEFVLRAAAGEIKARFPAATP